MAVIDDYWGVFPTQEESDDDVGSDIAQSTCDDDFKLAGGCHDQDFAGQALLKKVANLPSHLHSMCPSSPAEFGKGM